MEPDRAVAEPDEWAAHRLHGDREPAPPPAEAMRRVLSSDQARLAHELRQRPGERLPVPFRRSRSRGPATGMLSDKT